MSIGINTPYIFAIVDAGDRFPQVLVESGNSAAELLGHYSLRQIGLDPSRHDVPSDPILRLMGGPRDYTKETWMVDAWSSPITGKNERDRNLALVVRGLPFPSQLGIRGGRYIPAIERELAILSDALKANDRAGVHFHTGLITAILSELDKEASVLNRKLALMQKIVLTYFGIIGVATIFAAATYVLNRELFSKMFS